MEYTKNYHLPQWDETDRIMRTDFNKMCADLEAGLNKNASDAASDSAKASAGAAAAQATADSALTKANNAYCPANKPYVVGTYKGSSDPVTVKLGFRPQFLLISHQYTLVDTSYRAPTGFALAGAGVNIAGVAILDDGFTVSNSSAGSTIGPPNVNDVNRTYAYIAFR